MNQRQFPPLLLALLLAGCVGATPLKAGDDDPEAKPLQAGGLFEIPNNGAMLLQFKAQDDTMVELNISNNRNDSFPPGTPGCSFLQWTTSGYFSDGEGVGSVEGPGKVLRAGVGGHEIANVPGGGNGLVLALDGTWELSGIELKAGESLWLRISAWSEDNSTPLFRPTANVTSDGNVSIHELPRPSFTCSGGYVDSDIAYIQTAYGPVLTSVVEGQETRVTSRGTDALVTVSRDPRYPAAACRAAILLDGSVVHEDENVSEWCVTRYEGPPGAYSLEYNATGAESHVFWALWS